MINLSSVCSYVLLELVETERDYVRDLGLVVEVSQRPLELCGTPLGGGKRVNGNSPPLL